MQAEKFSIPEYTAPVSPYEDKEQAARKVRKELNGVFLLAAFLVVYFVFSCYSAVSTTSFLIFAGLSAAGLYGLWRFHKRVERNEIRRINERKQFKPFIRPAEDLEIDSTGIHWRRAEPEPDHFDIAWNEIKSIKFGGFEDAEITLASGQKLKTPLIMNQHHKQIAAHIEHYTKLKKSVTERYYMGETLEDILYD
jgi:hypothetical protein